MESYNLPSAMCSYAMNVSTTSMLFIIITGFNLQYILKLIFTSFTLYTLNVFFEMTNHSILTILYVDDRESSIIYEVLTTVSLSPLNFAIFTMPEAISPSFFFSNPSYIIKLHDMTTNPSTLILKLGY